MTHDDEVCPDLFGDPGYLLSGGSHAQPCRRREAHDLDPLHPFLKNRLISCNLFFYRDREASFEGHGAGRNFYDSQQDDEEIE